MRYFFTTSNGECFPDEEGSELATLEGAKAAAVAVLCENLRGHPEKVWATGSFSVIVSDAANLTLFTVQITTVLSPAIPQSPSYDKRLG